MLIKFLREAKFILDVYIFIFFYLVWNIHCIKWMNKQIYFLYWFVEKLVSIPFSSNYRLLIKWINFVNRLIIYWSAFPVCWFIGYSIYFHILFWLIINIPYHLSTQLVHKIPQCSATFRSIKRHNRHGCLTEKSEDESSWLSGGFGILLPRGEPGDPGCIHRAP